MDRDTLGVGILVASAICATVAGLIRYGLLPYLREQLQATREIHQQVTTGSTTATEPATMREELAEVRERVDQHAGELDDAVLELRAMALMFDGHLEWSQAEVDRIWSVLNQQVRAGLRPDPKQPYRHRRDTL
jgi:hypothetical protein